MGFDQYHEPPGELPPTTRTFARLCASLTPVGILFQAGDVVEHGEQAEADAFEGGAPGAGGAYEHSSLGIGSLKGASR